jgi:hypothetical protein
MAATMRYAALPGPIPGEQLRTYHAAPNAGSAMEVESEPPGSMLATALIGTDTSHCRAMWRMTRSPSRRPADGPACQGACLHCDCLCFLFGTVERCGRKTQGPACGPCARASTASRKPSPPPASTCRRPTGYSSCPMMNEMTAPRLPHGHRLTHRSCSRCCI